MTTDEVHAMMRVKYSESLYHVAKYLCDFKDVSRGTHGEIINALEAPTKNKLICVPRGSLKSSICNVAYPIWSLIRNPNLRILIDSEIYSNSATFLREIKGILQSKHFMDVFGSWRGKPGSPNYLWNEGEINISARSIVKKEASITCSGIGAIKVGQHYDIRIGDDYNSNKNSLTPENRKKVIDHHKYMTSILENDGTTVIVGTRYSTDDVIGFIIKNQLSDEERALLPKGAI